jgi:hypothetical protein
MRAVVAPDTPWSDIISIAESMIWDLRSLPFAPSFSAKPTSS